MHQNEIKELKALHEADIQTKLADAAQRHRQLGAEVETLGEMHRSETRRLIEYAETESGTSRAVVAHAERQLEESQRQHEAALTSLKTMLALESQRLRDARQEVLELTVALGNERAERQILLSRGDEASERIRQMRVAWERELDEAHIRSARREAELIARVEELEAREAMRKQADGAAAASAQTSAALLHELQVERARHAAETGAATERVAACERALRRERSECASLRELLEVARDELAKARTQALRQARGEAAARVRAAKRKPLSQPDVARARSRYMAL